MTKKLIVASALSLVLGLQSCSKSDDNDIQKVPVTAIELTDHAQDEAYTLYVGRENYVRVNVLPHSVYADRHVLFSSSDERLFKVDNQGIYRGRLTGLKEGVGEVIIESLDGSGIRITAPVNVIPVLMTELKISNAVGTTIKVPVFRTAEIKIGILPADATYKDFKLTSGDESVFTVNRSDPDKILLEGKNLGASTLTLEALDGSGLSETYNVEVEGVYDALSRTGWTASAKDIFSASFPAHLVIDGIQANSWVARTELPGWLMVDMQAVKDVDRILCESRYANNVYHTKTIEVYVSDKDVSGIAYDDVSFVKVGTAEFGTSAADYVHARNVDIVPTIRARHIKILVTESNVRYSTTQRYEMGLSNVQPYVLQR